MSSLPNQDVSQSSYCQSVKTDRSVKNIPLNLTNWTHLDLLPPQELVRPYELSQPAKGQLKLTLQQLKETLALENPVQAMASIKVAWQQLCPVETVLLEEEVPTGTSLKRQQVEEFDHYMKICRIKAKEPAKLIVTSVLRTYLFFLEVNENWPLDPAEVKRLKSGFQTYIDLIARVFDLPILNENERSDSNRSVRVNWVREKMNPMQVWKKSHWIFMVLCQALIVCLKRFVDGYQSGNLDIAKIELQTAAELMWASGVAMKVAGSFNRQVYESEVRPTMMPGNPQSLVKSEPLSGLMMWEHDYLVNVIWKKELSPILKTLPANLQAEHAEFIQAYQQGLSGGHKSVCAKFGGGERGALTASHLPSSIAVENLEKFEQSRLKFINPQKQVSGKCPFH